MLEAIDTAKGNGEDPSKLRNRIFRKELAKQYDFLSYGFYPFLDDNLPCMVGKLDTEFPVDSTAI